MQHKRSSSLRDHDALTGVSNERGTKRARRQSTRNQGIDTTDASRGIHRHFQTALFVSPGILIFCPQLSENRPYPTLLVKSISPKLPSPSEHAVVNSNLDKLITLHLPKTIANAAPYSYGQPTILSRSHNPRYFVAFFPKLSDDTRKRLGQEVVYAVQKTTSAADRAVQAIVNGADAAAATSVIPLPGDVPTQGFDTEIEEYEDNGGVLVLYTRPESSAYRIIYSHTFDIYASWRTDYCALDCKWLFAPRKWVIDGRDTPDGTSTEDKTSSKVNGVAQDDDMKGIFGEEAPKETVQIEDGHTPMQWKPPHLKRVPFVGPVQPTYSSTNPSPTFVILFANHRLNLYFSALPSFPSTTTLRSSSNDPTANLSLNSSYNKLDVLSCPILTPSVVLYESIENPSANSAKQEPDKPDSSAASSPEQPLLQQQQQQIMQQQKQVNSAPFIETDSLEMGALASAAADRPAARRKRQILPGQATVFMREEDETIWVGFRSYRPTRILVPSTSVQSTSVLDDVKVNSSIVEDEGEEEDWICITELRLDLIGGVPSVSARPIPPVNFPYSVYNDPLSRFRLSSFAFVDSMPARNKIKAGSGYDMQDTGYMKEGRDLSFIMIFSQARKGLSNEFQRGNTSRIIHCKISREDLEVSDAFGLLSPAEKGSKKTDPQNLSRLEWVSKEIDIETFPNTSFTLLKSRSTDDHLNRVTLLSNTLPGESNGKIVYLDLNPLKISQVGCAICLDHEILDVSLNAGLLVGPSNTGSLALVPDAVGKAQPAGEVAIDIAEVFALAIINNTSYEDLLRQYQPIFKKLKGPSLDEALQFVWKILQEHDASRERKKGDWLVPFLQLQAAVFRSTMDDRLLTSTMLLHLISSENLFSRCRIDELEKKANGTVRQRLSYDVESLWLLLSHMEWYFALVRAIVFRSILLPKDEPDPSHSAQSTTPDFLLSHPVALELLQTLCKEIRRFALFVSKNGMPSAPYPGSSQTALLLDVISTSQLQSVLRDRVEKFGIRLDAWEQILQQLLVMQEQRRNDDEIELMSGRLSPARLEAVPETIAVILQNTHLVPSQLQLFESGYQTPDLLAGRDILSKDTLNGQEVPGQLYRQCSLCHDLGTLWNYPVVRAYGAESGAAHWMSQWAARCICGGSWV